MGIVPPVETASIVDRVLNVRAFAANDVIFWRDGIYHGFQHDFAIGHHNALVDIKPCFPAARGHAKHFVRQPFRRQNAACIIDLLLGQAKAQGLIVLIVNVLAQQDEALLAHLTG